MEERIKIEDLSEEKVTEETEEGKDVKGGVLLQRSSQTTLATSIAAPVLSPTAQSLGIGTEVETVDEEEFMP